LEDDPLEFDCRLWRTATKHTEDMIRRHYFDKKTLGSGWSPEKRAKMQGTSLTMEVIARMTKDDPEHSLRLVLKSPSRCDGCCFPLMNPHLKRIGVAWENGDFEARSYFYFTADLSSDAEVDVNGTKMKDC